MPPSRTRSGRALLLGLAVAVCGGVASADWARRIGSTNIFLTADRDEAVADGRCEVLIRAECRRDGRPVPDGTPVLFTTDLGDLTADQIERSPQLTVLAKSGSAEVFLTSAEDGTANVAVAVGGDSRNVITIDFVPEGSLSRGRTDTLFIKGATVSYSVDHNLIDAWDATVSFRGLKIFAEHMMIDLDAENIRCRAPKLQLSDKTLEGADAYYQLRGRRGVLRRFGDEGIERILFSGATLSALKEGAWEPPADPFKFPDVEADAWMVAKSAIVVLRKKVILRNATLWVNDSRVMRMPPNHIIGMAGYAGATSTALHLSSTGGLSLDYPYYFKATSGEARSIRIQKGSQIGSLVSRQGWALALEDEYETKNAAGVVSLEGIFQNDWGLQWRHVREFTPSLSGTFYVGTRSFGTLNADAGFSHRTPGGRLATRLNFAAYPGFDSRIAGSADYYFNPAPIGKTGLFHRLGLGLNYTNQDWGDGRSLMEYTLNTGVTTKAWRPRPDTSIRPSVDWVLTLNSRGELTRYMRFGVSADKRIGSEQLLGLRYSLDRRTGGRSELFQGDFRQQVSLNYSFTHGAKWSAFMAANYDLTNSLAFGFANVSYRFDPKYRFSVAGNFYGMGTAGFNETDFVVWRQLGQREIGLRYSTFDHRISLELAGATF